MGDNADIKFYWFAYIEKAVASYLNKSYVNLRAGTAVFGLMLLTGRPVMHGAGLENGSKSGKTDDACTIDDIRKKIVPGSLMTFSMHEHCMCLLDFDDDKITLFNPHNWNEKMYRRQTARNNQTWLHAKCGMREGKTFERCSERGTYTIKWADLTGKHDYAIRVGRVDYELGCTAEESPEDTAYYTLKCTGNAKKVCVYPHKAKDDARSNYYCRVSHMIWKGKAPGMNNTYAYYANSPSAFLPVQRKKVLFKFTADDRIDTPPYKGRKTSFYAPSGTKLSGKYEENNEIDVYC